jgi:hypothetical protein
MTKQTSYAISQQFQWFFIILGGLAYAASVVPYVYVLLGGRGTFDSMANTTLLIGTLGMPLLVAAGAAALTRRRGLLDRAWVATGAALMGVVINELLMWVGSVLVPSLYEVANIIALIVAALSVMAVVWIDRQQIRFGVGMRHWRVISVAGLFAAIVAIYFVDAARNVSMGGDGVMSLVWPVSVLLIFLSLTVFLFRRMPVVENSKRVLLMVAVILMATMAVGGVMSLAQLNELGWLAPDWLGFVVLGAVYVLTGWFLRSPVRVRAIRQK